MSQNIRFEDSHPHLKEFNRLLEVARKESDRGAVLVHASMLDELLKRSIEAYLIAHKEVRALTDGFNAPIGTLATRTLMAFALGLISEREYQELILIRKVRNDFAHAIETSFSDQSVAALECPANFVPESMRQTGMRGAWDGTREEAYT